MRRVIPFDCLGDTLVASLDCDPASACETGLLIVSGGNEIRAGAHRGMALLAARLAADGVAVFRYDRRGVGDSSGENGGFESARDDLLAAAAAFRAAAPQLARIVGFGNCDAATTLALWGRDAGLDAVILANPWVVVPADGVLPPAAIRAHYRDRLRDPHAWLRLLRGGVSFAGLFRSLRGLSDTLTEQALTTRALPAISAWGDDATIVLAARDHTAIAYAAAARRAGITPRAVDIDTASHSFARPADAAALDAAIRAAIARG